MISFVLFCFLKLEPSSFVCACSSFILSLCYIAQNVMKGMDMSLLSLEKYSIFGRVFIWTYIMKLNIGKSCLSHLKTFIFTGKFRLGRPQKISGLTSCPRQGQAKTCVKPVRCVTCSWEKSPQTLYSCLTKLPGSISHSLPVLCHPPSSGVLQVCLR